MNIGIIVHSKTGKTMLLSRAVASRLTAAGHNTDIELLKPAEAVRPRLEKLIKLEKIPSVEKYDIVLAGCPVWGFTASPVIMSFLKQLKDLKGKKALAFVTMSLPFKGQGLKSVKVMNSEFERAGAQVLEGTFLHAFFKIPQKKLDKVADTIVATILK